MSRDSGTFEWPESVRRAMETNPMTIIRRPEGAPMIKDLLVAGNNTLWPDEASSSKVNSAIVDCEELRDRARREGFEEIAVEAEIAIGALEDLMAAINEEYS